MNFTIVSPVVGLMMLLAPSTSRATDWPQWRGPARDGVSKESIEPWPAEGPKVLWRASLGTGFSSISVSAGRLYTMGNLEDRDTIWCFDAATGRELWHHTYSSKLGPQYYEGGPGATPTVEGDQVFTISKWGDVFCLDAKAGKVVWHHNLGRNGIVSNRWGFAGSPLVRSDLVLLNAGSAGTALNRKTGELVWSTGTNATGYASPTLFRASADGDEAVLIFAAKFLVALDPATGREHWRFPWETGWDTNNSDPLLWRNQILISSFSRGGALLAVRKEQPVLIYETKDLFNNLSPGVIDGDFVYASSGEAKRETDFRCIELATGKVRWKAGDISTASVLKAGSRLLVLSEKGELVLAEASPEAWKPLARAQVLGGLCWTPPALADGRLYARNAKGDLIALNLARK